MKFSSVIYEQARSLQVWPILTYRSKLMTIVQYIEIIIAICWQTKTIYRDHYTNCWQSKNNIWKSSLLSVDKQKKKTIYRNHHTHCWQTKKTNKYKSSLLSDDKQKVISVQLCWMRFAFSLQLLFCCYNEVFKKTINNATLP